MLASAAMVLDTTPEELVAITGHWGTDMVGGQKRGYHIQELQDAARTKGKMFAVIEARPVLIPNPHLQYVAHRVTDVYSEDKLESRFDSYLKMGPGILIGDIHAWAWDGERVYDPLGRIIENQDFDSPIRYFLLVLSVESNHGGHRQK